MGELFESSKLGGKNPRRICGLPFVAITSSTERGMDRPMCGFHIRSKEGESFDENCWRSEGDDDDDDHDHDDHEMTTMMMVHDDEDEVSG